MKSFLNVELDIENYEPEADREGIVRSVTLEKGSDGIDCGIV